MPWRGLLTSGDRIVVTGAAGWLGRSLLGRLLPAAEACGATVLGVASRERLQAIGGTVIPIRAWNDDDLMAWEPTVVVHTAFVTRERLADLGEPAFQRVNRDLTDRACRLAMLPSVRAVVHTSSGAALDPTSDAYGRLKAEQEVAFEQISGAIVNARVWSVSGPECTRPDEFAFTSFVRMAVSTGVIRVTAQNRVWRKYVDAGQMMEVSLLAALHGHRGTIDSTGELVELHHLAERTARLLSARVESAPMNPDSTDGRYYSDSPSMDEFAARYGLALASLDEQIILTAGTGSQT